MPTKASLSLSAQKHKHMPKNHRSSYIHLNDNKKNVHCCHEYNGKNKRCDISADKNANSFAIVGCAVVK